MPHTDLLDKLGDKGLRITFKYTSGFWHLRVDGQKKSCYSVNGYFIRASE